MTYDYSEVTQETPADKTKQLSELALLMRETELEVEQKEAALKEAKQRFKDIAEVQLPSLMDDLGCAEFTTSNGIKITVREDIRAAIPENFLPQAIGWLEENNHGDLVKREFKILFGRNEEEWAKEFEAMLSQSDRQLNVEVKRGVHPSTLSAFVRGLLEQGEDFPQSLFGVFRQRIAKLKLK